VPQQVYRQQASAQPAPTMTTCSSGAFIRRRRGAAFLSRPIDFQPMEKAISPIITGDCKGDPTLAALS